MERACLEVGEFLGVPFEFEASRITTLHDPALEEAIAAIDREKPDLVFLENRLPEFDGIGLCRRLRENPATNHIYVVICSASRERAGVLAAIDAGVHDYIAKPFQSDTLQRKLAADALDDRPLLELLPAEPPPGEGEDQQGETGRRGQRESK